MRVEEEMKPTGDGARSERRAPSEWRYVETALSAHVEARAFTLRPHWKGPASPDDIRAVVRMAAAAPALYDEVKAIKSALGMIEWSSPEHAEEILDHIVKTYYSKLSAALALVDGPQTEKANYQAAGDKGNGI